MTYLAGDRIIKPELLFIPIDRETQFSRNKDWYFQLENLKTSDGKSCWTLRKRNED